MTEAPNGEQVLAPYRNRQSERSTRHGDAQERRIRNGEEPLGCDREARGVSRRDDDHAIRPGEQYAIDLVVQLDLAIFRRDAVMPADPAPSPPGETQEPRHGRGPVAVGLHDVRRPVTQKPAELEERRGIKGTPIGKDDWVGARIPKELHRRRFAAGALKQHRPQLHPLFPKRPDDARQLAHRPRNAAAINDGGDAGA